MRIFLSVLFSLATLAAARAAVVSVYYNTTPFEDESNIPLEGTAAFGDLIQLILTGPDGVIDPPDEFGNPGDDDFYIPVLAGEATSWIGANEPMANWNMGIFNDTITFDDSLSGLNAFVRFWNNTSAPLATHYGDSVIFTLPVAPPIGAAFIDVAPNAGSPHITNTPFSAIAQTVPEPRMSFFGAILLFGIFRLRFWVNRRPNRSRVRPGTAPASVAALLLGTTALLPGPNAEAQLPQRFEVSATRAIMDASGESPLPGGNTLANTNATQGALIQIFQIGPDGEADWPGADGHPTGDDILLYEIPVGSGISPTNHLSGLFALSLTNLPPANAVLYARAYDASTIGAARHWGQSVPFPVTGLAAMDVSQLGLTATTLPIGTTLFNVDSDNDGQSDFEEWLAGTHATDPSDWFRIVEDLKAGIGGAIAAGRLKVEGVAGRTYILERCTSLGPECAWVVATNSGPLSETRTLLLADPNPPASDKVFYRVRVETP